MRQGFCINKYRMFILKTPQDMRSKENPIKVRFGLLRDTYGAKYLWTLYTCALRIDTYEPLKN
jgi:hypothetical protein